MSQTSTDVNINVNPVYADVIQVKPEFLGKSDNPEMFNGWRNWSLQDSSEFLRI